MRYAVVIESEPNNYSAYIPDLPGCVATGKTRQEVLRNIHDAARFHLEGMKEDGLPLPLPSAAADYIEVEAA